MTPEPAVIDPFCCDISRDSDESLFGSAPSEKTWFLLEYRGTWHRKATEQNELPKKVKAWLDQALAAAPSSRLLFIRKPRSASKPGRSFFVAQTDEASPRLYHFQLERYASLLSIDLASLLNGDKTAEVFEHKEPLYLVCTNGRRDRCCAREGPALYGALASLSIDQTWQCTHLGGHRFAPNLVTFPSGAFYGRLEPDEAGRLLDTSGKGELLLDNLRGRSCYDAVTQAGEYFLRQHTGRVHLDAYSWEETEQMAGGRWRVSFLSEQDQIHRVTLAQEAAEERLVSCHPAKTKTVAHFQLVGHQLISE